MLIDAEEAKEVLLEHYKKSNPDVTEIVIEGLISIAEANKLLADVTKPGSVVLEPIITKSVPTPEVVNAGAPVFDRPQDIVEKLSPPAPGPGDPAMIALVQSLQTVIDDGRILNIKYHKGPNKGYGFELTKGLESRCTWCGYIAMSDKDLGEHKKTFHKEIVSQEKAVEQEKLSSARAEKQARLEEHSTGSGWGKKKKM